MESLHRTCRDAEKSDDQAQAMPPGHGFSCRTPPRCTLSVIASIPTSLAAYSHGRVRSFLANSRRACRSNAGFAPKRGGVMLHVQGLTQSTAVLQQWLAVPDGMQQRSGPLQCP